VISLSRSVSSPQWREAFVCCEPKVVFMGLGVREGASVEVRRITPHTPDLYCSCGYRQLVGGRIDPPWRGALRHPYKSALAEGTLSDTAKSE
jgi:hypothetical protein